MIMAGNNPYNGNLVILFIVCIVIAIPSLVILILSIRKRIRINKGLAIKTKKNIVSIALLTPIFVACIIGIIIISIGKSATNNDIEIDLNQKISLDMSFDIYAKENISNLELTFEFTNKNGTVLTKKIKNVGNVRKRKTYQISIKLTEFELSELVNIYSVSAEVTGGRISYFYHSST